ncbi:hypothetical protein MLD38_032787 [Melastoma candidum]|uniref:Uncharacterized protein n=1 Tax=Melastoma candidum TaxID=119954 RepID=A0ACB9M4J7_9MYRT|nr:hypothetical protein MLD38_032787 [Melastoma candidum]
MPLPIFFLPFLDPSSSPCFALSSFRSLPPTSSSSPSSTLRPSPSSFSNPSPRSIIRQPRSSPTVVPVVAPPIIVSPSAAAPVISCINARRSKSPLSSRVT